MNLRKQATTPFVKDTTSKTEIPYGLCQCGCNRKTTVCTYDCPKQNIFKGQHRRFIHGHHAKELRPPSRILWINGVECRTIPLTRGMEAIVDAGDFEYLCQWTWHATKGKHTWYARSSKTSTNDGKKMHQVIMQVPEGYEVDHVNWDGLDNRRCNLRQATNAQNAAHSVTIPHSSRYRGVSFNKTRNRWAAQINIGNRITKNLGWYKNEKEAALAFDVAVVKLRGEFAVTNFGGQK